MITVAGSNSVREVYNAEYHNVPSSEVKSGPQASNPGMYLYGATLNNGGIQSTKEINQPVPNPKMTFVKQNKM